MITLMLDKFLLKEDCDKLIEYYKENESKSSYKHGGTYPVKLENDNKEFKFFIDNLNDVAKNIAQSKVDWMEIVRWPQNSFQDYHWDDARIYTTISSIVYLNDDYEGGETNYQGDSVFKPKKGRALFFNGKYYRHGVKKIEKGIRYTVAAWYRLI